MASTADTLTATGAPVTLAAPAPDERENPSSILGYEAIPGQDEIVALVASKANASSSGVSTITATGYGLTGQVQFQTVLADANTAQYPVGYEAPVMSVLANGNVAFGWNSINYLSQLGSAHNAYAVLSPSGAVTHSGTIDGPTITFYPVDGDPALYATATGFNMAWNAESQPAGAPPHRYANQVQPFDMSGLAGQGTTTVAAGFDYSAPMFVTALAAGPSGSLQVTDNVAQYWDGTTLHDPVPLPGEPAHAITNEAAATLANGSVAVGWIDSGTDYVAIYNASTNSFGPQIGLDWGGATDLHTVALADGGFAVSWSNGGQYKGELFTADGTGGGVLSLTGQFAALDSHGDLYTVGLSSSGAYVVQTYAVSGSGGTTGGGSGSSVSTSDSNYVAPDGVTTITLTGSNQTIHANNAGDTINSDNTANTLYGGTGADTFHLGRGGDVATGGGGNDTFAFAEIPWAADTITDFGAGDVIDLNGLLSTTKYTGTNAVADRYITLYGDGHGGTLIYAQYDDADPNSTWRVADIAGVTPDHLQYQNGDFTWVGPNASGAISTSAATYKATADVKTITLTGSHQDVTANDAQDTTIYSDNTGNTIHGGTGDDTIHIGRGGDTVDGGTGADTFVFDETPWAPATINHFDITQGDTIDVSGLLAKAGYTGSDPIADGYLKMTGSQLLANYHQPGNDGWWVVANVLTATLHYADGVLSSTFFPAGRTVTTSTGGEFDGAATVIMTGSNGGISANNGGDTLIDQGQHNALSGAFGNDTLVFGPSTTSADGWSGADTFVINAHPTGLTSSAYTDWIGPGSRIDVHNLLNGVGYTGADPVADGHVWIQPPAPDTSFPPALAPRPSTLMWDPDGAAGPAAAIGVYSFFGAAAHYQDGFFLFG